MSSPTSHSATSGEETSSTNYSAEGFKTWDRPINDVLGIQDPFTADPEDIKLASKLIKDMAAAGVEPASNHRQFGYNFGVNDFGKPLTSFIMVQGKHSLNDYHHRGGIFSEILDMGALERCVVQNDKAHPGELTSAALFEFRDTRQAEMAIDMLTSLGNPDPTNPTLFAKSITAEQFCFMHPYIANEGHYYLFERPAPIFRNLQKTFVNGYDGQFIVHVEAQLTDTVPIRANAITEMVGDAVFQIAELKIIEKVDVGAPAGHTYTDVDGKTWQFETFVIELYHHHAADLVVGTLRNYAQRFRDSHNCEVMHFWAAHYDPNILTTHLDFEASQTITEAGRDIRTRRSRILQAQTMPEGTRRHSYPHHRRCNDRDCVHCRYEGRGRNAHGNRPIPRAMANVVNMSRVVTGSDTRTTFMLRNIPSELNFYQFKHFLDRFVPLKYDFLYLRVDFDTLKNVGYGFINIDKPSDIAPFLRQCEGEFWPIPGTTKRVEVSYANVQTLPQILEKFRNSSVMLQTYMARPHLYYLEGHPLEGQEVPFPPPDNGQKQMRSSQNAQTFGLYSRARTGRLSGNLDRGNPNIDIAKLQARVDPSRVLAMSDEEIDRLVERMWNPDWLAGGNVNERGNIKPSRL